MKKKIFLFLLLSLFLLTGCIKREEMEDIDIITTIYPIQYVTNRLYGNYSTISSIYPGSTNIEEYTITNKQLKDFSEKDLLIYNGNGNEKIYATSMLNNNNSLRIIDATYGIETTHSESDIWINPANILMIAQNIKTELGNLISNHYIIKDIKSNYELLKVDISELESELKKTADNSKNKTIISLDESLKFLEKYGFTVINLTEDKTNKENNIELAKSLLKKKSVSYIFITEYPLESDILDTLVNDYKAKKLTFRTMETITENDVSKSNDYLSIMNDNINNLKEETYK